MIRLKWYNKRKKELSDMKIILNKILQYKEYLINEEKSTETVKMYVRNIQAFHEWLDDRDLTKQLVLEYKNYIIEKYAPTSVK